MRLCISVATRLVLVIHAISTAQAEQFGASLPPVSQLVDRAEGAGTKLTHYKSAASNAQLGFLLVAHFTNGLRLDLAQRKAVRESIPDVEKLLKETGARGVLIETTYVRDKATAAMGTGVGPPNMSVRLLGNRVSFVGAGDGPVEVLTLALTHDRLDNGASSGRPGKGNPTSHEDEYVPERTQDVWISRGADGKLSIADVDHDSLYRSSRDILSNNSLSQQLQASAYRNALTNMISSAERYAGTREAKEAAEKLLRERRNALQELKEIDDELREELRKAEAANEANADADKYAIIGALAGLGSSVVPNGPSNSSNSNDEVIVKRGQAPSGAIIEMIKHRTVVEGKIIRSDGQVGAFLQQNGKVIYVELGHY